MMHTKANDMGMTQRVALFLDWLRVGRIEPQKGIATLNREELANSTLAQSQGIRTSLVPPPPPPYTLSQQILMNQPIHLAAPDPPPAPTRQAVTPEERWGANMRSLLQICNTSTALQLPDIWRTVALIKKDRT